MIDPDSNPCCQIGDRGRNPVNDDDTDSVSQTTQPPAALSTGSTSLEDKNDPPDLKKKRKSGVYINGEKVLDLDRRDRPLTKRQSPSSPGNVPGGSPSSQIPSRPISTLDNQGSAASAPQARYPSVPAAFRSPPEPVRDGEYHLYPLPQSYHFTPPPPVPSSSDTLDGNYHPYPIPQSSSFRPPLTSHPYPDDAFEADVEDDIPRPKNPRRKTRTSGIYVDGKKVRDLNRVSSPAGSRRERIVIIDPPPTPYTTPNVLPYTTTSRRPVIVDERPRPRVEIEIVDGSRSRRHRYTSDVPSSTRSLEESTRPRHTSEVPRSTRSLDDDDEERAKRRQRRRERKDQEEADARLRDRIAKANADINNRPPVSDELLPAPRRHSQYQRPAVEILDPGAEPARVVRWDDLEAERRDEEIRRRLRKEEGKEMERSAGISDREAELAEAVRRLKAEQDRYEDARRLSQVEEGKGKGKEGEGKQPSVELPNREAELIEAVRRLDLERELREERARRRTRKEMEEEEIQRKRLMERMMPTRRAPVGPSSRRRRVLYDDGLYRWE